MQSVSACPMNEADGHTQPGKPGRMIVVARLDKSCRIGNIHTSFVVVCPFHAPVMSFPFWLFLFYGFSPEVFLVHHRVRQFFYKLNGGYHSFCRLAYRSYEKSVIYWK